MHQSYREYPHKALGGTLAATDKVSEFHTQNGTTFRYFFEFPLQGMHEVAATIVFS